MQSCSGSGKVNCCEFGQSCTSHLGLKHLSLLCLFGLIIREQSAQESSDSLHDWLLVLVHSPHMRSGALSGSSPAAVLTAAQRSDKGACTDPGTAGATMICIYFVNTLCARANTKKRICQSWKCLYSTTISKGNAFIRSMVTTNHVCLLLSVLLVC